MPKLTKKVESHVKDLKGNLSRVREEIKETEELIKASNSRMSHAQNVREHQLLKGLLETLQYQELHIADELRFINRYGNVPAWTSGKKKVT